MKIKVMPFLTKKGNRVAKAAIEFSDDSDACMRGCQLVGFTICDGDKGLWVQFPSSLVKRETGTKPYFFLRPLHESFLANLENAILDTYESMVAFNSP